MGKGVKRLNVVTNPVVFIYILSGQFLYKGGLRGDGLSGVVFLISFVHGILDACSQVINKLFFG